MRILWYLKIWFNKRKNHLHSIPGTILQRQIRIGFEAGQSLPAALIALAVGSLLLTPFLAFVSSRSLGTGTAQETFNELYAADAGVEFGIWSLLNNPAFLSQVDLTAGTAQPLTFLPGSVNGFTPTITVTALPIGNWIPRPSAPTKVDKGGSLAYGGGDLVYALGGDKKNSTLSSYSIGGDVWTSTVSTPAEVQEGGSLVFGDSNFLYALLGKKGKINTTFWRYNTTSGWTEMAHPEEDIGKGGSLVYNGVNDIYALGNKKILRYDISSDSWSNQADIPGKVADGAALVFTGGNTFYAFLGNSTAFWRYNTSSGWTEMASTPSKVTKGSSLAYFSGNYLYALQGNSTGFLRYNIAMNSWTFLTETPLAVGNGGSLLFTHSEGGFALRGGNETDFWEFEVTPPRYDISVQAGISKHRCPD